MAAEATTPLFGVTAALFSFGLILFITTVSFVCVYFSSSVLPTINGNATAETEGVAIFPPVDFTVA